MKDSACIGFGKVSFHSRMSNKSREEGDNYTPDQEEFVAGRLPHQKEAALRAKKTRAFIAQHPGCSSFDLAVEFGRNNGIDWLLQRNLVRYEGIGGRRYYVVPL